MFNVPKKYNGAHVLFNDEDSTVNFRIGMNICQVCVVGFYWWSSENERLCSSIYRFNVNGVISYVTEVEGKTYYTDKLE